jgi:membrane fusion protein, copper/silver efflux system
MKRTVLLLVAAVALAAVAAGGGYWFAMKRMSMASTNAGSTTAAGAGPGAAEGRKPLYWYDPMYPQHKFDKPGKSPFMDMQLVPKYADESADEGTVSISPRVAQNLGIRTTEASAGSLAPKLTAVGSVEYNERSFVVVQPRVAGFVEKLFVRAPLDPVRDGDPLVELLFPEWAAAQEEFLVLQRMSTLDADVLKRAGRQRLVLLGMSDEQIAAVEREGKVQARVTLRAPVTGVIAELGVREGMTVSAGATLFRIAGLGTVWVVAEVPEAQASMLLPGAKVEARVPAYPEQVFAGRVSAILPEVNATTRTIRTRVEIANTKGQLKPGMYATLAFSGRGRESLLVPTDAVIRTGERSVVIVIDGKDRFRAADVEVGMESGGNSEIRKGLKAGDKVVVSGQFLIDSEASLRGTIARLEGASEAPGAAAPMKDAVHKGRGKVADVDPASGRVELDHDPIPSMKWPSMKMGFAVEPKDQLANVKRGDTVEFELRSKPNKDGDYVVTRIKPAK